MKKLLRLNTIISLYTFVFLLLTYGVYLSSGTKYLDELGIYYLSLLIFYLMFNLLAKKLKLSDRLGSLKYSKIDIKPIFLASPIILFILIHFMIMGGSPTIKALSLETWQEIAKLRESIGVGVHPLVGYGSSIVLKACLPFFLLYFLIKEEKLWYWFLFLIGTFYVFSMMQKSFIVGFLFPVFVYSIISKKYIYGLKYAVFMIATVVSLSKIANPNVSEEKPDHISDNTEVVIVEDSSQQIQADTAVFEEVINNADKTPSKLSVLLSGLQRRVMIVPGMIVSAWFDHIPKDKPFLKGEGYRFIARLKGKEHRSYASELYPLINPKYAKQGFKGTVNTASFMYDYANFGIAGLVLSGIFLSFIFVFIELFFADDFILKLSLNLYPLLFLTSTAITTLMFSGGWSFFILFYYLFLSRKKTGS